MPPKKKSSKATGSAQQSSEAGPSHSSQPGAHSFSKLSVRQNAQPNASQSSKDGLTFAWRKADPAQSSGSSEHGGATSNPSASRRDPSGNATSLSSDPNVISPAPTFQQWEAAQQTPADKPIPKQEMFGVSSLKRQAWAMSATIESQRDTIIKVSASIETMEKVILIINAKIQQLKSQKKSPANELPVQSLEKHILELQNWMQSKREVMRTWENESKPKWVAMHKLVQQIMAMAHSWEYRQRPDDLRDYLAREKAVLERQQAESLQQPQVLENLDEKIRQLRRKMVQMIPKDFTGWDSCKVQFFDIDEAIGDLYVKRTQAWRIVGDLELAERQWDSLQRHYQSILRAPPATTGMLNDNELMRGAPAI